MQKTNDIQNLLKEERAESREEVWQKLTIDLLLDIREQLIEIKQKTGVTNQEIKVK